MTGRRRRREEGIAQLYNQTLFVIKEFSCTLTCFELELLGSTSTLSRPNKVSSNLIVLLSCLHYLRGAVQTQPRAVKKTKLPSSLWAVKKTRIPKSLGIKAVSVAERITIVILWWLSRRLRSASSSSNPTNRTPTQWRRNLSL